jgi:hypothetical protein
MLHPRSRPPLSSHFSISSHSQSLTVPHAHRTSSTTSTDQQRRTRTSTTDEPVTPSVHSLSISNSVRLDGSSRRWDTEDDGEGWAHDLAGGIRRSGEGKHGRSRDGPHRGSPGRHPNPNPPRRRSLWSNLSKSPFSRSPNSLSASLSSLCRLA